MQLNHPYTISNKFFPKHKKTARLKYCCIAGKNALNFTHTLAAISEPYKIMIKLIYTLTLITLLFRYGSGQHLKSDITYTTDNMITELNKQLTKKLRGDFESAKLKVTKINDPHPAIIESLRIFSEYNIEQLKNNVKKDLIERLIPAWLEYQTKDSVDQYDCILFEYSDQEVPPYEAFSYGLYNMTDYKLTIERHYFKSADHHGWEAGAGLLLEPFSICKPFHIEIIGANEEYEKLHYKDKNSGVQEILALSDSMCKMVLNEVFAEADKSGLFSKLKIKSGGIFMYDVHDGGNVQDPFYLKQ